MVRICFDLIARRRFSNRILRAGKRRWKMTMTKTLAAVISRTNEFVSLYDNGERTSTATMTTTTTSRTTAFTDRAMRRMRKRMRTMKPNARANVDFDFADDAYVKLFRNAEYHRMHIVSSKRGEISLFKFPKNILSSDGDDDGSSRSRSSSNVENVDDDGNNNNNNNSNIIMMPPPTTTTTTITEIGLATGLAVFSSFWALWEFAFKKAVFGEDQLDAENETKNNRNILQGVDVTRFPIFKDDVVLKAVEFAAEKHKGQQRKTGEPYVIHLVEAARILAAALPEPDQKFGATTQEKLRETIAACLLMATLDDEKDKERIKIEVLDELREHFGESIAELVHQVSRMSKVNAGVRRRQRRKSRKNYEISQEMQLVEEEEGTDQEKLEELLLVVVKDPRVFLIKIAERLHNMRTLYVLAPVKAKHVAEETLSLWCSFAEKLGIWAVKSELEDLCFAALDPLRFEEIVKCRDQFWLEEMEKAAFRKNFKGTIVAELVKEEEKEGKTLTTTTINATSRSKKEEDQSWTKLDEEQRAFRRRLQCVQPFEALTTRDGSTTRIDEKVLRESPMRPATQKSLIALAQWQNNIFETLRKDGLVLDVNVRMSSRLKSLYSTSKKMARKNVPFSEVYDGRATRIIIGEPVAAEYGDEYESGLPNEIEACYALLNAVHKIYRPLKGEYDDYITKPKQSGYKSLHTAVRGDDGKPLEVQIRTRAMHDAAEWGVAAHWMYKIKIDSNKKKSSSSSSKESNKKVEDVRETPAFGQVVQLISPSARGGGGVIVDCLSSTRCLVAKPIPTRGEKFSPDARKWAERNEHESLLRRVSKKGLTGARQETKEYYILEFCLYADGRWHEQDQLGKIGLITMEPLNVYARSNLDVSENENDNDGAIIESSSVMTIEESKLRGNEKKRYQRIIEKWNDVNGVLGITEQRSKGLRAELDERMTASSAYLSGTPSWDTALARTQPKTVSSSDIESVEIEEERTGEAQFSQKEAMQLEAELGLTVKRNGNNGDLKSASVDLTSTGLLIVTWDSQSPSLRTFEPGTTAGTVRKQMAIESSDECFVETKYVNVNSVMVPAEQQLQDADCVFLDDLAVY